MKEVNAKVMRMGQPCKAIYMGTRKDGSKHFMEIKLNGRQVRTWVPVGKVDLHEGVKLKYADKATDLF